MTKTTIQLDKDTKELLDEQKHPRESYDDAVRRLLGENENGILTEEEVRSLTREEVKKVISEQS